MPLRPDKTKLVLLTTRQKERNLNFSTATYWKPKCYCSLRIKTSHKILVVTTDTGLSWSSNVTTLCKSTSKKIYTTPFEPSGQKMIPSCHIQSTIDCGSTPWHSASTNILKPLASLHKRALKAILKKTTLVTLDFKSLSILPLTLTSPLN